MRKKTTRNARDILDREHPPTVDDLRLRDEFDQMLDVAQQVYDLRAKAGLTQKEMAKRIGTSESVICRLEDADYNRHSMAMLRRIAGAVGHKVQIRFVPDKAAPMEQPSKRESRSRRL